MMEKNKTLDQLFAKARNQETQYSLNEVSERFRLALTTESGSNYANNESYFTLKFWIMVCSAAALLTASLILFSEKNERHLNASEKEQFTTTVVDSIARKEQIPQEADRVSSNPSFSRPKIFVNQMVDSLFKTTDTSPIIEPISSLSEQDLRPQKQDDPYVFPKLTEKEIKETQKQKKAMLRALEKMDKKSFAFIPSGSIEYKGKTVSIQSFIIQKTEVSNLEYRTFLFDLLLQGRKEEFLRAKPDQQQWNNMPSGQNNKMVDYYFSHPAYDNYPVVNISREGAEMYCKWLTDELHKAVDEKKKSMYNPIRLPIREEWIKSTCLEPNKNIYPWHGKFMRNKDGLYEANFRLSESEMNDHTNAYSACSVDITAPVNSYFPNYYGIHNLSGNVAEMVYNNLSTKSPGTAGGGWMNSAEELKILGPDPYSGVTAPHPCIGFRMVMTVSGE